MIVLAVKPGNLGELAREIGSVRAGTPVISFLAGVTEETLRRAFPGAETVRAMTGLAFGQGSGLSAIAESDSCSPRALRATRGLLGTGGEVLDLSPEAIDLFTGTYACGLGWLDRLAAHGYAVQEAAMAMASASARLGDLPLTLEALAGVLSRSYHGLRIGMGAGHLYDRVATPGGMTQAGGEAMDRALARGTTLTGAAEAALRAALERAWAIDPAVRAGLKTRSEPA